MEKNIMSDEIEQKNKFIEFIKNNYILIGILILGLIIRLYYFFITKDQTLWWDELCYGSLAKNFITHQWNSVALIIGETTVRPLLFSVLWSFLLRIDFTEIMIRFVLEIIPSFLAILLIYFVAEKMYSKRVALISAFILSISWIQIFYSMRLMTHIPGLLFSFASIYFFFKATETKNINFKYFCLSIFLLFISVFLRYNYALIGFIYLLILIVQYRLSLFKQMSFWLGGIIGSIPLFLFFAINIISYHKLFPSLSAVAASAGNQTKAAFYTLNFIPPILQLPFFIMFIIGIIIAITQLVIGYDSISEIKKLKSHLFLISLLVLVLCFLVFYIKYSEDRYLFECLISMILIISFSLDFIYEFIKRHSKFIAIIFLVIILASGAYYQMSYGNSMILGKVNSYAPMKTAFLWLKDNVPKDSVILGVQIEPYSMYYSSLTPIEYYSYMNTSILNGSRRADYFVYHQFAAQNPDWITFINSQNQSLDIIYATYFDPPTNKQPAIVIAKYNRK